MSLEELPSPPQKKKGKEKKGENVWTDPTVALGQAHNVIFYDELKALSSVPSHELVCLHVHKLLQVTSLDVFTLRVHTSLFLHIFVLFRSLGNHCAEPLIISRRRRRLLWPTRGQTRLRLRAQD